MSIDSPEQIWNVDEHGTYLPISNISCWLTLSEPDDESNFITFFAAPALLPSKPESVDEAVFLSASFSSDFFFLNDDAVK